MKLTEIQQIELDVQQALKLCDTETADALVGNPQPDEYGALIKGAQGVYSMLWMLAKENGMQQTKAVLEMGGKGLLILLTLVHYAYALGVKKGKADSR